MKEFFHAPHWLLAVATALLILALCFKLYDLGLWFYRQHQIKKRLKQLQHPNLILPPSSPSATQPTRASLEKPLQAIITLGEKWKEGRYGSALLAAEDKRLLDLAGFHDNHLAQSLFIFTRSLFCLGLPLLLLIVLPHIRLVSLSLLTGIICVFFGFAFGWMLPKWYVLRRIKFRKKAITVELVLFVDILRLLQGVGLSIDQALHTITERFQPHIPVLAYELKLAQELYTRGRTREQSFNRLTHQFQNDDLSAICRLIQQIDKHGGAVQEPLAQFGQRLQEERRLYFKERIGILTVKMTGVMIVTLMPALIIITGGAGFLAVIRGLARVSGGV